MIKTILEKDVAWKVNEIGELAMAMTIKKI